MENLTFTTSDSGQCNVATFIFRPAQVLGTHVHWCITVDQSDYLTQQGHGNSWEMVGRVPQTKIASKLEFSFISYDISAFGAC